MSLRIQPRGETLYVQGTLLGKRVRMSTGLPKHRRKEANIIRIQTENAILSGEMLPNTRQLFGEYIDAYEHSLSTTRDGVPSVEKRVIALLRNRVASVSIDLLTIKHMTQNIVKLWDNVQDNSRRRYINVLNAVVNYGNTEFAKHVPSYPNKFVDDARSVHFTADETKAFLAEIEGTSDYMNFMYLVYLGVRLGELRHMELDRGSASVFVYSTSRHTKTVDRVLPVPNNLSKAIRVYGFRPMAGHETDGKASLAMNLQLKQVCRDLGIAKEMRVHDLRHTFAYLTAQKGADLAEIQGLLGHKDIAMTMRYRGFIPSKARHAVKNLLD
tara:strand:- start:808 stop:1788 length:981 start_codon:yes stop_codon:yes gene_type:complete